MKINEQIGKAWDDLMGGWLPDSGYQPDDRPTLPSPFYGRGQYSYTIEDLSAAFSLIF